MGHYFNFSLYKERNRIKKAKISLKTTLQIELQIEYEDLLAYHIPQIIQYIPQLSPSSAILLSIVCSQEDRVHIL